LQEKEQVSQCRAIVTIKTTLAFDDTPIMVKNMKVIIKNNAQG